MKAEAIFDKITREIIESIESGMASGKWEMPWRKMAGMPSNAATGNNYSGGNVLVLWATGSLKGYGSSVWATYKQWEGIGAQVRKGEKSTSLVKWVSKPCAEHGKVRRSNCVKCKFFPVGFSVFNADQVDGWTPPVSDVPVLSDDERITAAEAFLTATGATIKHGGDRAYYASVQDYIGMPTFGQFVDAASYYSTLAHESVHWTGHESRLARTFGKRFGDEAYAAEELVAELGAAFLCAELGISNAPREDHALYLSHWLTILRGDSRALFEAASKASKAVEHLRTAVAAETVLAA